MKVIKTINTIGYIATCILLLIIATAKVPGIWGYRSYCILSESMEPEIPTGSLVYVQSAEWDAIEEGDCITFFLGADTEYTATHRVIAIDQDKKEFTTKGDANLSEDLMKVRENLLIGKVVYTVPVIGFGLWFLQTATGKICVVVSLLMVLIPAGKAKKAGQTTAQTTEEKKVQKKKTSPRQKVLNGLVVIILLMMMFLVWELVKVCAGYVQNKREYSEVSNTAVTIVDDAAGDKPVTDSEESVTGTKDTNDKNSTSAGQNTESIENVLPECPVEVDFAALWEINEEIVAWIYQEDLEISYPILYAADNNKYLYTSVKGTSNSAGSIFVDAWNHGDFGDPHTIVYGHNMKNGSMFGSLKKLRNKKTVEEFTTEHDGKLGFWIITPNDAYYYEIFSIHAVKAVGETYALFAQADQQFVDFVNKMAKGTEIAFEKRAFTESDRVVTLSTCTGNDEYRLVVQGVRVSVE